MRAESRHRAELAHQFSTGERSMGPEAIQAMSMFFYENRGLTCRRYNESSDQKSFKERGRNMPFLEVRVVDDTSMEW